MVQLLMKHGADIYIHDHWGNSALTDAKLSESDKIFYSLLKQHRTLKENGSTTVDEANGEAVPTKAPSSVALEPDTELTSRQKSMLYYDWRATESGAASSDITNNFSQLSNTQSPWASMTCWQPAASHKQERPSVFEVDQPTVTTPSASPPVLLLLAETSVTSPRKLLIFIT